MQPGFSQWGGHTPAQRLFAADRPPLGRARGGGLVAQGRGGRCVVSLDAFFSSGCEKARFGALTTVGAAARRDRATHQRGLRGLKASP